MSLKYDGDGHYKTTVGGCISLCQRVFILAIFCVQSLTVFNYGDNQISSYDVRVNRATMDDMNLDEYNVRFYFGFLND